MRFKLHLQQKKLLLYLQIEPKSAEYMFAIPTILIFKLE